MYDLDSVGRKSLRVTGEVGGGGGGEASGESGTVSCMVGCDTGGGSDTGGRRMQRREMQLCNNYATVTTTRKALTGAGGEVM